MNSRSHRLIPSRLLLAAIASAACGLTQSQSLAQPLQLERPPDEVELKAAYCLAVIKVQLAQLAQLRADASSGSEIASTRENAAIEANLKEIQSTMQSVTKKTEDNLNRVQSYLLPRLQYLDGAAILAAHQRGETDYQRQRNSAVGLKCTSACSSEGDKTGQCHGDCMKNDPLNRRIFQCRELDFLPY